MDSQARIFGVRLSAGIERRHLVALLACGVVMSIAMNTFSATIPWTLGNMLHVPTTEQGRTIAFLTILGQLVNVFLLAPFGMFADRVGRRSIFAFGMALMSAGVFGLGFARDVTDLVAIRFVQSIGLAASMALFSTLLADYAANESRGRITGLSSLLAGISMLFVYGVLMKIPALLTNDVPSARTDMGLLGRQWFTILGALCIVGVPVTLGLARFQPAAPHTTTSTSRTKPVRQMVHEAWGLARSNPMLALSFAACTVVRGDSAVSSAFILLWVTQYANATGRPPAEAAAVGGVITTYGLVSLIFASPLAGWLCDRFSHTYVLLGAMLLAPVAFIGFQFIDDPLGAPMKMLMVFLILGQAVGGIASQAIAADHAPPDLRGSVMGFFSACGSIGALLATSIGGYIFDHWRPSGPFAVFCTWDILVIVALIIALARQRAMTVRPV